MPDLLQAVVFAPELLDEVRDFDCGNETYQRELAVWLLEDAIPALGLSAIGLPGRGCYADHCSGGDATMAGESPRIVGATRAWRRRRRLLGIAALVFCAAGALVWLVCRQHQREQAIANIRALGGDYAEGNPTFPAWTDKPRALVGDRLLTPFAKPAEYKSAHLWFKPATDADLERLAAITDLTQLDLSGTKITDRGLASLKNLTRLDSLELAYTRITDAGLVHLLGMTRLGRLRLERCAITDAGIPHLQAIPSPQMYVHLQETKVTSVLAGKLVVKPPRGAGEIFCNQPVVIRGSCTVAEANYRLDEIDIVILGHEEGSDEAAHFGGGSCRPVPAGAARFEFELRLPAPNRAGDFTVSATTLARMHGLRAFYTAGACKIHVLPHQAQTD